MSNALGERFQGVLSVLQREQDVDLVWGKWSRPGLTCGEVTAEELVGKPVLIHTVIEAIQDGGWDDNEAAVRLVLRGLAEGDGIRIPFAPMPGYEEMRRPLGLSQGDEVYLLAEISPQSLDKDPSDGLVVRERALFSKKFLRQAKKLRGAGDPVKAELVVDVRNLSSDALRVSLEKPVWAKRSVRVSFYPERARETEPKYPGWAA